MTILFVLATPGSVFLAGDSRQFPTRDDTRKKVFLVGKDALIAQGGVGVIPSVRPDGGPWDALSTLNGIVDRTGAAEFGKQLEFIAKEFGERFADVLSRFHEVIRREPPAKIDMFFVKRTSNRRVYVAYQEFHVRSKEDPGGRWQHEMELGVPQIKLDGIKLRNEAIRTYWSAPFGCAVETRKAGPINRGQEAAWITKLVRGVAAQSEQCSAQIGGTIRVATVDNKGARWLVP